LTDPLFPAVVCVEAFNPLCPGDADASGLPLAVLRVVIESLVDVPLDLDVLLSAEGWSGPPGRGQRLSSRPIATPKVGPGVLGYLFGDGAADPADEVFGTFAAAVVADDAWLGPTWTLGKWDQGLLQMWRSFCSTGRPAVMDGPVDEKDPAVTSLAGTMGVRRRLDPFGSTEVLLVLGWHFPNRKAWEWDGAGPAGRSSADTVGNHYTVGSLDAWDVVSTQVHRLPQLEAVSRRFASAFWESDLSPAVKEAALFNLSTLRSQTVFRTEDGYPLAWEGCFDSAGSCLGSCTHVWNYDLATPFLFAGLARQMRELELGCATGDDGAMSFRIMLPLERARELPTVAADGQFGCVVKLFREWRLSGDDAWLARLWPACRSTIEFAWVDGGWDADRDGVAEGAQHTTMDVEYFGPNPLVQGWYLAALEASAAMAAAMGDDDFATVCRDLRERGARATEALLFNGSYYQQRVVPPGDFVGLLSKSRLPGVGAERADAPEYQIGDGCLIDQVVGDTYARIAGLSGSLDRDHVRSALSSIHHFNYVHDFAEWTNSMRTYAVAGERGHVVLSYPRGLPDSPMPYWSEVWTGLEYAYALACSQEMRPELAVDVVSAVRERFTGGQRNPFDEAECGHHYARALASWGVFVALTGFSYDGRSETMEFSAATRPTQWFWSNGDAWGTVRQSIDGDGVRTVHLEVAFGTLRLSRVEIGGQRFAPPQPGPLAGPMTCELVPA
jgi:uncharacterized protein (DUF608 family)